MHDEPLLEEDEILCPMGICDGEGVIETTDSYKQCPCQIDDMHDDSIDL